MLGVYRPAELRQGKGDAGQILPADRRVREPWRVPAGAAGGAEAGEIVRAELLPGPTGAPDRGSRRARVTARLGRFDGAASLSRIAIASLRIPEAFPDEALAEAASAGPVGHAGREDLRALPLVTIDGADARDFDDAVFAEPAGDGFRIVVAIADVAHYVRPGSALDEAARERGNSVYFPDRVVPMLPPALSEHWCSLAPGAERGALFAEIFIDAAGRKRRHRFGRGLMRSAARLTYEAAQNVADGGERSAAVRNLYAAWRALAAARRARGPLDLELPERKVVLDAAGRVGAIRATPRLDSHRLIEEFMILANVAAAEEILSRDLPGLFRAHADPAPEKIASLATFLRELGVRLRAGGRIAPADLTAALAPLAGTAAASIAAERTLQSLPQAGYSPANIGHFGLALAAYAHFTSPIRRYADLVVHRALIAGLGLGAGGNESGAAPSLESLALHLGIAERRAVEAERAVLARAQATLLAEMIGSMGEARISGVTRSLLFVTMMTDGAEGIVPVSTLPADSWRFEEASTTLTGARSGWRLTVGQRLRVRIAEADPISGRIVFRVISVGEGNPGPVARPARGGGRNRLR